MPARESIDVAEAALGHKFADRALLRAALTHPSAAEGRSVGTDYERLEFLGDSVLGCIVADELFRRFPDSPEGELTLLKVSLVAGPMLSAVAGELGFEDLIEFGESELGTGTRGLRSALENVYESVVGALYLDGGWDVARAFVLRTLGPHISRDVRPARLENPKSLLQECTQRDLRVAPEYRLVDEKGPAHDPTFTSVVLVNGARQGRGSGSSKKESEAAAALDALRRMGYRDDEEA